MKLVPGLAQHHRVKDLVDQYTAGNVCFFSASISAMLKSMKSQPPAGVDSSFDVS
jgi:hypothetical protein